jgi:hypothetical protein
MPIIAATNGASAFVSLCHDIDVQRLTFEAYMNKKLVKARPLAHIKIGIKNLLHLLGLVSPVDMTDGALIPAWVDGDAAPGGQAGGASPGLRHKAMSVFVLRGARC